MLSFDNVLTKDNRTGCPAVKQALPGLWRWSTYRRYATLQKGHENPSRLLKNSAGRHWPLSHSFSQRLYSACWVTLQMGVQAQGPLFREVKTQLSRDLHGLNHREDQFPHPHEVVSSSSEREHPRDRFQTAMPSLT